MRGDPAGGAAASKKSDRGPHSAASGLALQHPSPAMPRTDKVRHVLWTSEVTCRPHKSGLSEACQDLSAGGYEPDVTD